ncbi:siroheme synthase [Diaporthe sp. PMI_573]|nr:siroheme synthase [Diaporthaceae sp. PMI_573]
MGSEKDQFLEVQGGGSLILAWQVKAKNVLVIGGGEVAAGRILNCLNADAAVTVICPSSGLNPEVAYRVSSGQVTHIDRKFQPSDLDPDKNVTMVLTAIDDPEASTQVWKLCKERRIPANIADVPPECDFYFGSVHRDGPLQIMVSTNGKGPRLAASIRKQIATTLPNNAGAAVDKVGRLRAMLRKVEPGPEAVGSRMGWMIRVSDAYSWEAFCDLTEEDMENLLAFYSCGEVPSLDLLKSMRRDFSAESVFDGSFGFSVGC